MTFVFFFFFIFKSEYFVNYVCRDVIYIFLNLIFVEKKNIKFNLWRKKNYLDFLKRNLSKNTIEIKRQIQCIYLDFLIKSNFNI